MAKFVAVTWVEPRIFRPLSHRFSLWRRGFFILQVKISSKVLDFRVEKKKGRIK